MSLAPMPDAATLLRMKAEREGRGGEAVTLAPEDAAAVEKTTQHEVVKLFRAFGCTVYSLSQARATKQTPGLPDLWVFCPRLPLAWWWETKRPKGGRHSPAQEQFAQECAVAGTPYGTGSRADAEAWLIRHGLAERGADGLTLEPTRP